jgi:hypothetical protein
MKIKKEFIILGIVVCGLLLYVFQRKTDRINYQLPSISPVAEKEITKIELQKGTAPIVIKKEDDNWYIDPQGYLADDNKIKGMLEGIADLFLAALVSTTKSYDRYELDDKNRIGVKAWQGETLRRDFHIGKIVKGFRHTIIKFSDDEGIYHAQGNLRDKFDVTVDNLRDKKVLHFKPADIRELMITKGDKALTFARTEEPVESSPSENSSSENAAPLPKKVKIVWQTAEGDKVDESRLNRLLSTLSNLSCEKYIDDRKKEEFKKPIYAIVLKGLRDYSLSVFDGTDTDNENYPAVSTESDYPFELSKWKAEEFMNVTNDIVEHLAGGNGKGS